MAVEDHSKLSGREVWRRKIEYIFSLAGYTTGASDFWRFPYLFWKNGGVSFLIPFLLALPLCALPVYYLEVVVSQYSGHGMFNFGDICPLFKGIGYTMFVLNLVTNVYAASIRVFVMEYLVYSVVSDVPWTTCGNEWNTDACVTGAPNTNMTSLINATIGLPYFVSYNSTMESSSTGLALPVDRNITSPVSSEEEFWLYKILAISSGIDDFGIIRWELLMCSLVLRIILVLCSIRIIKSVGKVMYVTSILPITLLLAIWIQTLTLPGSTDGLLFFFRPKFESWSSPKIWMEAGFTAVYTLSIGYGGNIEIASHGKFHSNCLSSVMALASIDVIGSLFTSLVLFSVLGVMANEMGTTVDQAVTGGTSVSFVGFTKAFSFLPAPRVWSIIFFLAVFIALFDYVILVNEIVTSFLKGMFPILRKRHVTSLILVAIVTYVAFLPFCTQAGPYLYHLIDWYVVTWSVALIAFIECIVFMWIYGGDRINTCIKSMNNTSVPHLFRFLAAYVCPVVFVLFLILSTIHYRPPTYGSYHYPAGAEALGWLFAILPSIPIVFCMIRLLATREMSLKQKLLDVTKPVLEFGPIDKSHRDAYLSDSNDHRTLQDIAFFNATGRTRQRSKENDIHVSLQTL